MKAVFNVRLYIYLTAGFVLATAIGTISHDAGHYVATRQYGLQAQLHYASVSISSIKSDDKRFIIFDSLYKVHEKKILSKESSPEKEYFLKYRDSLGKVLEKDSMFQQNKMKRQNAGFIFTLSGPLQTMITGTIGFIYLYINRSRINNQFLNFKQWLFVFLAFFWSRQIFNLCTFIVQYIITGKFSYRGDEAKLSHYLNIPVWSANTITGLTGALILAWVLFKIIPKQQRFTFLTAGITGSIAGWYIWMHLLGPAILP